MISVPSLRAAVCGVVVGWKMEDRIGSVCLLPVVRRKTHSGNVRKQLHPFLRYSGATARPTAQRFVKHGLWVSFALKILTLHKCFAPAPSYVD
jgi:hypothetical protein